jgi:hypothetical protein
VCLYEERKHLVEDEGIIIGRAAQLDGSPAGFIKALASITCPHKSSTQLGGNLGPKFDR